MSDRQNLSDREQEVFKQAVHDAYFLQGAVERANRKFETAFHTLEKAKQHHAESIKMRRKAIYWQFAAILWWIFSALIWW